MTLLVEALAVLTLVASQPPPKLDVAPGATQQHGPVLLGIAGLGKKKTPTNVLIGKSCFSRERREKRQAQQKAWQLAGVESDSSHRAVQMSEEISGCIRTLLAPEWLFRSVQNLIAPAIGVIIAAKGARRAAGAGRICLL